jgi:hypothetical protein
MLNSEYTIYVDQSGGQTIAFDLTRRWVSVFRMFRFFAVAFFFFFQQVAVIKQVWSSAHPKTCLERMIWGKSPLISVTLRAKQDRESMLC